MGQCTSEEVHAQCVIRKEHVVGVHHMHNEGLDNMEQVQNNPQL